MTYGCAWNPDRDLVLHPRRDCFDNYVYLAVHPLLRKEAWKIEPSELDLLLGKSWIVSVHYGPLPGLIENSHLHDRIPRALGHGPTFFSTLSWI